MSRRFAIIGMAGRFPRDVGIDGLWGACLEGQSLVDVESSNDGGDATKAHTVRAAGRLRRKTWFDHELFDIPLGEARTMSSEQRLFLSVSWQALMDAGYAKQYRGDKVGVFVSGGAEASITSSADDGHESTASMLGREADYIGLRTSFRLGLNGPSVCITSACSSSLVAVHLACQSLLEGGSDIAIAGGVNILQHYEYEYVPGGIQSGDGYCRVFDEEADGTVFSEGAAAVVLCREEDAATFGDRVYATIIGSAVNNDGSHKAGFTAPSVEGQVRVIRDAIEAADVDPNTVEMIEAHGTGTLLGDPVEVEALRLSYRNGDPGVSKRLVSVKANIGHLGRAAGICGLIHGALSIWNRTIAPQALFREANSLLGLGAARFVVPTECERWSTSSEVLRAGVSSFGFGGTNCHMIIEGRDHPCHSTDDAYEFLLFSGRTCEQAHEQLTTIARWMDDADVSGARIAKTLACGRQHHTCRTYLLPGETVDQARARTRPSTGTRGDEVLHLMMEGKHTVAGTDRDQELRVAATFLGIVVRTVSFQNITVRSQWPDELSRQFEPGDRFRRDGRDWKSDGGYAVRFLSADTANSDRPVVLPSRLDDRSMVQQFFLDLWQSGLQINWGSWFTDIRTVSLPDAYPSNEEEIERTRHQDVVVATDADRPTRAKDPDFRRWLYAPSWTRLSDAGLEVDPIPKGPWLVIGGGDPDPCCVHVVSTLRNLGADVLVASLNDDTADVLLSNHSAEQYMAALQGLSQYNSDDEIYVVHTWATRNLGEPPMGFDSRVRYFERAQEDGFYSLLEVGKALKSANWTRRVRLIAIGVGLSDFFSTERIEPEKATVFGPLRVLPQEVPNISCIGIDAPPACDFATIASRLLWAGAYAREASLVAVDNRGLWSQIYTRIATAPAKSRLRRNGVYLITGGLGGIGMTLAEYFSNEVSARLILTGLSGFPDRDDWDDWIAVNGEMDEISQKIARVRDMENAGSTVMIVKCDASDVQETRALIVRIRQIYGELNGVVHAAGIFETQRAFRGVDETERIDCHRRFLPKVHGTLALAESLEDCHLDFCLMQSSLSSILGGIGFVAYAAGNVYMDAFAQRYRGGGIPWMSINWDGWIFRDPAEEVKEQSVIAPGFASTSFGVVSDVAIRPTEGAAVLDILLKWGGLEQVAVSSVDLGDRFHEWISLGPLRQSQAQFADSIQRHGGDDLGTFVEIVEQLIETSVERDDNFFAIGGDSLMGVELVSLIGERFGVIPSIVDLFENPKIEDMFGVVQAEIERKQSAQADQEVQD